MQTKGTILYIGGFELPDKNAAAHRVLTIAKLFRDIGYDVEFLNKTNESVTYDNIEGFVVHNYPKDTSQLKQVRSLFASKEVVSFLKSRNDIIGVVAYNYPAIALNKIRKYCKKKNIKCIADVTEWYKTFSRSILYTLFKGPDSFLRMRYVHKRLDGIIAISDYLEDYYKPHLPVVNLPPLVDKEESKWKIEKKEHEDIKFVYAGSPSKTKERLDLIVEAVEKLREDFNVSLTIVGITEKQFYGIYGLTQKQYACVKFLGKVSHLQALSVVAQSDYSFIIRDDNRVTRAGFPTKFVESISAGCAVIANDNSNISRYINEGVGGNIIKSETLTGELKNIINQPIPKVDTDCFDYRQYLSKMREFFERI